MENQDITRFVVEQLGRHHRPDDIVKEVCEKTGMPWAEAEKFVWRIRSEHRSEIAGRQSGLLIGAGLLTTLAGLALSIGILVATLDGWIIFFLRLPVPYLGNAVYFGIGICLTAGGVIGVLRAREPK